nr:bark storage protein A [Ipomoea batatas]
MMHGLMRTAVLLGWLLLVLEVSVGYGAVSPSVMNKIKAVNKKGPFLGIVVPNSFEMNPLLQSPSFVSDPTIPFLDFAGRRFRIASLKNKKVIVVMSGLGMLNSGIATQLLLSFFKVEGVLHYGISGNANPQLQIGDVTIPQFWAHTGLWNWQRFGDGPNDPLALESNGDYTREIGYLNFSKYDTANTAKVSSGSGNLLNNVWYQPEEIFPIDGYPEIRQHAFWTPVNEHYFSLAKKLENMKLEGCVNSTCLERAPKVVRVKRGVSASVFVDNSAYRDFLHSAFNATPIDMETAAVALVCSQQRVPFIAIRALSDLAGGGSAESNEAALFTPLAAQNAADVLLGFISLIP